MKSIKNFVTETFFLTVAVIAWFILKIMSFSGRSD